MAVTLCESIVPTFRNTWFVTNVLPIVTHLEFQKKYYIHLVMVHNIEMKFSDQTRDIVESHKPQIDFNKDRKIHSSRRVKIGLLVHNICVIVCTQNNMILGSKSTCISV